MTDKELKISQNLRDIEDNMAIFESFSRTDVDGENNNENLRSIALNVMRCITSLNVTSKEYREIVSGIQKPVAKIVARHRRNIGDGAYM